MSASRCLFFRIGWFVLALFFVFSNAAIAQKSHVTWQPPEKAFALAYKNKQPLLVLVSIPHCGWCLKMKKEVLPKVFSEQNHGFVLTQINAANNHTEIELNGLFYTASSWAQKLHVKIYPSLVFISPKGDVFLRLSGFVNAKQLMRILSRVFKRKTLK